MFLSFFLGLVTGALIMFAARLADKNITTIVERYGESGSVFRKKPIIVPPPKDSFEAMESELHKQLNDE